MSSPTCFLSLKFRRISKVLFMFWRPCWQPTRSNCEGNNCGEPLTIDIHIYCGFFYFSVLVLPLPLVAWTSINTATTCSSWARRKDTSTSAPKPTPDSTCSPTPATTWRFIPCSGTRTLCLRFCHCFSFSSSSCPCLLLSFLLVVAVKIVVGVRWSRNLDTKFFSSRRVGAKYNLAARLTFVCCG